jgi:hypothetical protein
MNDNFLDARHIEIRSKQRHPIAELEFNQEAIKSKNQNPSPSNNKPSQEKK